MPEEKYTELIPPEGDEEVGKKVFMILAEIIQDKVNLGLHDRWMRNYELRKNKHWKSKSSAAVPLISANLVFTHIQRTANTMTDNNPTFNVAQVGAADEAQREIFLDLQRTAEHWWIDQEQQDILETSILNGEQYGIAIEKVIFDSELEGIGEVETVVVDPFNFGWYPVKLKDPRKIQSADCLCHFYPISVRQLKRKHPKEAAKIKADTEILKELGDDRRDINSQATTGKVNSLLVTISSVVKQLVNFKPGGVGAEDDAETLVCELWVRDFTMIKDEPVQDEIGRTIQTERPKYPGFIRYIKACNAGKLVLDDKPNPNVNPSLPEEQAQKTYLYDKFPFCAVNSVKDTSNAWGQSDLEQLEQLMMEINKSLSQMVLEKDRSARRKLVNPRDSGVKNADFTSYPGILNPTTAQTGQGIRYLEVPPPAVDLTQSIELFKGLFFLVAGTFELDQAQVQGREVIAYKAIAALLERAATMMRGKIRSYSRLTRERGRMYLSHVMNFYTEERWITYTDKQGQQAAKPINGQGMIVPAKLTVVTGSTMPISRVQQREEALTLYKDQAIDREELLDKLDWSSRADVLKRMQAGPVGAMMQKLQAIGAPPQVLDFLNQIFTMDDKKFEKGLKDGQIPPFEALLQNLVAQQQGQQAPDPAAEAQKAASQAEFQKNVAEIQKIEADKQLVFEKVMTERVDQQVKLAGIKYDEDLLKIERAKVVQDMEKVTTETDLATSAHNLDRLKTMHNAALSEDQHQLNKDKALHDAALAQGQHELARETATASFSISNKNAENKATGRGLKSDNRE